MEELQVSLGKTRTELEGMECAHLFGQIPRDEDGRLTSIGSISHEVGACHPCAFWFKGVCGNAALCRSCHYVHAGQRGRRLRRSKQARKRMKDRLQEAREKDASQPENSDCIVRL